MNRLVLMNDLMKPGLLYLGKYWYMVINMSVVCVIAMKAENVFKVKMSANFIIAA